MRVLVAPLEFKGTLTAHQAAAAIQRGILRANAGVEVVTLPLADGGPGSVEAVLAWFGGERMSCEVEDPLGRRISATWARVPTRDGRKQGVIEMAAASGLWRLAPGERDPRRADTFGTGQLIRAALDGGASQLLVCAGGSATNDGGSGALTALGARVLDAAGATVPRGGEALALAHRLDLSGIDPRLATVQLTVATDVTAPLLGASGASRVFGPQKGAGPADVEALDQALAQWSRVVSASLGRDRAMEPGAGAAGGLAFGLLALGAELRPGFEVIAELLELDRHLERCDLVLTGEGQLDGQTALGKGPWRLRQRAAESSRPVALFTGRIAPGADTGGYEEVIEVTPSEVPEAERRARASELLEAAAEEWARRRLG